jgi:hypothetical protein
LQDSVAAGEGSGRGAGGGGEVAQPTPDTWDEPILRQRFPADGLQPYEMEIVALLYIEALWRHRDMTVEASRQARRAVLQQLHQRLREQFVALRCCPDDDTTTPVAAAAFRELARVQANAHALCETLVLSRKEVEELEVGCWGCCCWGCSLYSSALPRSFCVPPFLPLAPARSVCLALSGIDSRA